MVAGKRLWAVHPQFSPVFPAVEQESDTTPLFSDTTGAQHETTRLYHRRAGPRGWFPAFRIPCRNQAPAHRACGQHVGRRQGGGAGNRRGSGRLCPRARTRPAAACADHVPPPRGTAPCGRRGGLRHRTQRGAPRARRLGQPGCGDLRQLPRGHARSGEPALPLPVHELHGLRPPLHHHPFHPLRPGHHVHELLPPVPGLRRRIQRSPRPPFPRPAQRLPRLRAKSLAGLRPRRRSPYLRPGACRRAARH